jgi:hypothetical protein
MILKDSVTAQTVTFSSHFFRYAFILYNDEWQAASVVDQAQQYKINGQPLSVSFYSNKK